VRQQLLREGSWVVLGQVTTTLASLLGVRLLTELLPADVYGEVSLLLGLLLLGQHVLVAPLMQGFFRFYSEYEMRGDLPRLRRIAKRFLTASTTLLLAVLLVGGLVWSQLRGTPYTVFLLLGGLLLVEVYRSFETVLLWAARRQRPLALYQGTEAWLKVGLALGAVVFFGKYTQAVLAGYVTAESLALAGLLLLVRGRSAGLPQPLPAAEEKALAHEILRFALPIAPVSLANWVNSLSDRYIVGAMLGLEAVGLYAAAYGLTASPFLVAQTVVGQTLSPVYFKAVSAGNESLARRTFLAWACGTAALCCLGTAAVFLLRNWIALFFLGPGYRAGSTLMPWIALGNSIYALCLVWTLRLQGLKRSGHVLWSYVVGGVAAVAITALMTRSFGMLGTAMACPCYFAVIFVMLVAGTSRRHVPA
jgi:O-antigen/teichoic acid export membrane protein